MKAFISEDTSFSYIYNAILVSICSIHRFTDYLFYVRSLMALSQDMDMIFSKADELPRDWIAENHAWGCDLGQNP